MPVIPLPKPLARPTVQPVAFAELSASLDAARDAMTAAYDAAGTARGLMTLQQIRFKRARRTWKAAYAHYLSLERTFLELEALASAASAKAHPDHVRIPA